jgi:hypothetical protein
MDLEDTGLKDADSIRLASEKKSGGHCNELSSFITGGKFL